ncbi:molybdenum cofactor guanylyltransferase [Crinalium epipsammum PCC 9333]|uniref:Probable molybdenum cofactor guanylyltransferase n=1 Tax=Crinalium epipsammum PCC 9333 TaxID=1173022 RepID=K9W519_9CYAN|nr:molybdenum cofactor guanylyltransferase [Crinalium epipsammum]AFZ14847.1 molybdenum cofactor guanylyltransferase [Crinalium epipsammum PCC 9333]
MNNQQLTAIVLAGGRSSRMGRDKALIPIQGTPLIRRVCEVALGCTSQVYVVTPWIEKYQEVLPANCQLILELPIGEETQPHGALVGFSQGLSYVQTDWVLLLACDLPRLRVEVLQNWVEQLSNLSQVSSKDYIALIPRSLKGWEPLCGFYHCRCLPLLTEFINQGGRSFQKWLAQHPVKELQVIDSEVLFNCNTPNDLAEIEQ